MYTGIGEWSASCSMRSPCIEHGGICHDRAVVSACATGAKVGLRWIDINVYRKSCLHEFEEHVGLAGFSVATRPRLFDINRPREGASARSRELLRRR